MLGLFLQDLNFFKRFEDSARKQSYSGLDVARKRKGDCMIDYLSNFV